MANRLTVGEAAALVDRSPDTLRRWEREGVIPPAKRDRSGWRYYDEDDVTQLRRVVYPERR